MDAFAKSMDKYFIPVKLGSDSITRKKGGADTEGEGSPETFLYYIFIFLLFAIVDIGISNIVSNAFMKSTSAIKASRGTATHTAEKNGGICSFVFGSAAEIALIILMFYVAVKGTAKPKYCMWNPTYHKYLPLFIFCSWILALNLMTNIVLVSQTLNVMAAGILNFFRLAFIGYIAYLLMTNYDEGGKTYGKIILGIFIFEIIIAIIMLATKSMTAGIILMVVMFIICIWVGFYYNNVAKDTVDTVNDMGAITGEGNESALGDLASARTDMVTAARGMVGQ